MKLKTSQIVQGEGGLAEQAGVITEKLRYELPGFYNVFLIILLILGILFIVYKTRMIISSDERPQEKKKE